jgi:hypothetical protein
MTMRYSPGSSPVETARERRLVRQRGSTGRGGVSAAGGPTGDVDPTIPFPGAGGGAAGNTCATIRAGPASSAGRLTAAAARARHPRTSAVGGRSVKSSTPSRSWPAIRAEREGQSDAGRGAQARPEERRQAAFDARAIGRGAGRAPERHPARCTVLASAAPSRFRVLADVAARAPTCRTTGRPRPVRLHPEAGPRSHRGTARLRPRRCSVQG